MDAARVFREIASQWNEMLIHEALAKQTVVWKFNPPGAPLLGGVRGRLVQSCKKAMFYLVHKMSYFTRPESDYVYSQTDTERLPTHPSE